MVFAPLRLMAARSPLPTALLFPWQTATAHEDPRITSNLYQQTVYPADPVENEEHIEYITEQIKGVRLNAAKEVIIMPLCLGAVNDS